jgi:hypothetical protein
LVIGLFVLVIAMNMSGGEAVEEEDTLLRDQVENAVPFQPAVPAPAADAPVEDMPVEGMPESVEE